ncbi:MAG: glutamate-5-semialdehyde dehydrogenase [Candidatus Spyradenecus sp.]
MEALLAAKAAARTIGQLPDRDRRILLEEITADLRRSANKILKANEADVAAMAPEDPRRDRLLFTIDRLADAALDVRTVSRLPDVLWEVLEARTRPGGLSFRRVRVPLGVVGCIYEARPNVTVDVAALCLRTGNVAVLKGGKEAARTNEVLVQVMRRALRKAKLPEAAITLLPPTHEAAEALMKAEGLVDVLIPRGSAGLIRAVREQALVPVIETGAGVCHIYLHEDADLTIATRVVANAKMRRVSVCNALDCLLVHRSLVGKALDRVLAPCRERGVEIHTEPENWGREWLSMAMSVRVVDSLDEALEHIARFGSGHSEAIVTRSREAARRFQREVDAACVYVNTPTSFTDGAEFGLGAEVGISTQKLHARGPMGLTALTTSKWLIESCGAVRPE